MTITLNKAELVDYSTNPISRTPIPCKSKLLWWQDKGLSYTATGYGDKIPTRYMVQVSKRWYRVYCRIFSNVSTLYIVQKGKKRVIEM